MVDSEIGRGATGVVYKIVTRESGRTFALKRISLRSLTVPQRAQKLKAIRYLTELHHPNVIRNLQAKIVGPDLCLIMEFASDGDLAQVLPR